MENWLELLSIRDIWVIIDFTNFYQSFIKDFSRINTSLISILKTTKLFDDLVSKMFKGNSNEVIRSGGSKANKMLKNSFKSKRSKNKKSKN